MREIIDQLATYTQHRNSQTEKTVYYKKIDAGLLKNNGVLEGFLYLTSIAVGAFGSTIRIKLRDYEDNVTTVFEVAEPYNSGNGGPKNMRIDFEIWNSNQRRYQITSGLLTSGSKSVEHGLPSFINTEEAFYIEVTIENTTTIDDHVLQLLKLVTDK